MSRYSREDVITERKLVQLVEATRDLSDRIGFESRFVLYAAGYLGMRAGEIAHFSTDWIDWHERMIRIPQHDSCTKGEDGDICGYCRSRAEEYAEANNVSYEEAKELRWEPKTPTSERAIPFDFDVRLELTIEAFADRYDEFPRSKATVNRRVTAAVDAAGFDDRIYPHSLRATAASMHASRDISPYALMSVMGWADLETARSYIAASDSAAAREMRSKYR